MKTLGLFLSALLLSLGHLHAEAAPFLHKTDLFTADADGYGLYRIPGIVVTTKGTVLAYCEAREAGSGDWGKIDVLMRRSLDGGKTWLPPQTIVRVEGELPMNPLAAAQNLDEPGKNTVNNPVAIVDQETGVIHFLYCLEYMRCFYMRSEDEGASWSEPVEITKAFDAFQADYPWKILATGPGHGIQLTHGEHQGRLVVPVWLSLGTGGHAHRPSVTSTIYSDDHGETWQRGEIAIPNTETWINPNETVLVQLKDGRVLLNARSESKRNRRLLTTSPDGATNWSTPFFDEQLWEPICMGGIVRARDAEGEPSDLIAFSNPHNLDPKKGKSEPGKSRARKNVTVQLSADEGQTWFASRPLEPGPSAYSDMAALPDGSLLCFYERGREGTEETKPALYGYLTVAHFNVDWVLEERPEVEATQLNQPDVLFIAVDDMNDWISLLDPKSPIKTPSLERLAQRGMLFTRAYCASPACNPSRTATLTGLRPTTSGVYGNKSDWRSAMPHRATILQRFRQAGYDVRGAGKIFHHHLEGAFHDPDSFADFQPMPPQLYPKEKLNQAPKYGSRNTDWGKWPKKVEDSIDFATAEYCREALTDPPQNQPLFLACGIFKPHSPFFAPPPYHQPYADIPLPLRNEDDWADLPSGADELMAKKQWFWDGMEALEARLPGSYHDFIQSYAACASFADAQIGRVLDALDAGARSEKTIIVLWSDHGFHLGEKDHIEKFALWEKANHIPLIVVAPGVTKPGSRCDTPVDLSALYPTLLELGGLPEDPACDGQSLVPLLQNPEAAWDQPALMTYGRGNHAVRTARWRFIRYADGTEELYDHESDPYEWTNLAQDPAYREVLAEHRAWLPDDEAAEVPDLKKKPRRLESSLDPFLGEPKMDLQTLYTGERFPNIAVTLKGTLLATWGKSKVTVRRSEDGGMTWGKVIPIAPSGYHGGGTLVDERTGDILAFTDASHPPAQVYMFRSQDDGKTWNQEPIQIRSNSLGHLPSMHMNEHGITLRHGPHAGRLLRPTRYFGKSNNHEDWPTHYTNAMFSDDGGRTWQTSEPFPENGTGEAALQELSDGRIYYNSRVHWEERPNNMRRREAWSYDGGHTWTDFRIIEVLPDGDQHRSYGCMGGLVRLPLEGQDILIFSNLDTPNPTRERVTVWASFDGGNTWPVKRLVYDGPSAYSSLNAGRPETASEGWIYLHFESGGSKLARFNLSWILHGEPTGDGVIPKILRP